MAVKKAPVRRKRSKKKSSGRWFAWAITAVFLLLILAAGWHYKEGLAYYFSFKTDKILKKEEKQFSDVRDIEVLSRHKDKVIGFDVSEYQGNINWAKVDSVNRFKLAFVFVRATAGKNKTDRQFRNNWEAAAEKKLIRGAYHYYRPNENSIEQAENFIKAVKLKRGDLPPVLDIERLPKNQSIDSLKVGLKRWLGRVEKHYKMKPIIYTGEKYYDDFLEEEFGDYTFWIANYNFFVEEIDEDWLFWQFTQSASVNGIDGDVDINIYNGTLLDLGMQTRR